MSAPGRSDSLLPASTIVETETPRKEVATGRLLIGVFAVVTFLNAALLFAVQPMFTKMVLPLLGGTPMVWNTCLLFFQSALLLGYLYAHASSRWLAPRTQGMIHLLLLLAALLFLPLGVARDAVPPAGSALPVLWLLALLTASLGLPFVALSAGAPMFQRWFASTRHPAAGNPYVLYVASNLGSFVALLAYPVLIEPRLRLSEQSVTWLEFYYALLGCVALALWLALRWAKAREPGGTAVGLSHSDAESVVRVEGSDVAADSVSAVAADEQELATPRIVPNAAWRLRWVLLSFAPSSLLIGVTTYLSTDVAAVPLLWIIPLALYLLTFVIVFSERPLLGRRFMLDFQLFIGLAVLLIIGMTALSVRVLILHLIAFFATAMVCHRELADSRPRPEHLTEFYLWMSLGGMLGGVFNVIVAPQLYDRVLEYPLAILIAYGLRPALGEYNTGRRALGFDLVLPLVLYFGMRAAFQIEVPVGKWGTAMTWTLLSLSALLASAFYKRPLRLALGAAAVFFAMDHRDPPAHDSLVFQRRSFFGVYRVHRWGEYLVLQHGTTTHGAQSLQAERRREPLTYYNRAGPLGDVFAELTDTLANRSVALVGLGTGTTACYAHPGEAWTFYEIDPVIAEIARSGRMFTYLRDCAPDSRIVLGDARLSLVSAPDASYDLIALDAFSSDAIPVHLVTREALALYMRKLKPGGSVVFHISNRYLSLDPVLAELARDARLAGASKDFNVTADEKAQMHYASRWVALSRSAITLAPLIKEHGWSVLPPSAKVRLWTDDFSDILAVLKY